MVTRNTIGKKSGNYGYAKPKYPKKFLFSVGPYNISFHDQNGVSGRNHYKYCHCAIWHNRKIVGGITLSTTFMDVRSIVSVDTKIREDYQGCNIAYHTYEALVADKNMGIHSNNQSHGAVKLWRKFANNNALKLYFVDDLHTSAFLNADAYDVRLNSKGVLEGINYSGRIFNPYTHPGSLLLVKRDGPLDLFIQAQKPLWIARQAMVANFKRRDRWKGVQSAESSKVV